MTAVEVRVDLGTSPRSAVLVDPQSRMTSNLSSVNESNMTSEIGKGETTVSTPPKDVRDARNINDGKVPNPASPSVDAGAGAAGAGMNGKHDSSTAPPKHYEAPPTPDSHMAHYGGMQNVIPGYYGVYPNSFEPPSPAPHYDATSFPGNSFAHSNGAFAHPGSTTPSSPARTTVVTASGVGGLPPAAASPLFPRLGATLGVGDSLGRGAPPSPGLPYGSPSFGSYQPYPSVQAARSSGSDDGSAWMDRSSIQQYGQSPQLGPQGGMYGLALSRASAGARASSFDTDSMLPPPALDQQDPGNPAYSPYGGSQTSAGTTFLTHQHFYPTGPPDLYNGGTPGSPLQPRPTLTYPHQAAHAYHMGYPQNINLGGMNHPMTMNMNMNPAAMNAAGMRPIPQYGQQFYPAASPGPPIQTTGCNKGPDGANLFIFHIPNNFTNQDMYNLFFQYGTLLSVRIMVEKESGRSRGFGFVSYDSPESAASAIKELNGFPIGNKRLKVQHKQIRPPKEGRDNNQGGQAHGDFGPGSDPGSPGFSSSLPPSGVTMWPPSGGEGLIPGSAAPAERGTRMERRHCHCSNSNLRRIIMIIILLMRMVLFRPGMYLWQPSPPPHRLWQVSRHCRMRSRMYQDPIIIIIITIK